MKTQSHHLLTVLLKDLWKQIDRVGEDFELAKAISTVVNYLEEDDGE